MIYDHHSIVSANRNHPGMVATTNGGNVKIVSDTFIGEI